MLLSDRDNRVITMLKDEHTQKGAQYSWAEVKRRRRSVSQSIKTAGSKNRALANEVTT